MSDDFEAELLRNHKQKLFARYKQKLGKYVQEYEDIPVAVKRVFAEYRSDTDQNDENSQKRLASKIAELTGHQFPADGRDTFSRMPSNGATGIEQAWKVLYSLRFMSPPDHALKRAKWNTALEYAEEIENEIFTRSPKGSRTYRSLNGGKAAPHPNDPVRTLSEPDDPFDTLVATKRIEKIRRQPAPPQNEAVANTDDSAEGLEIDSSTSKLTAKRAIGVSHPPENYTEKLCSMRPVEVVWIGQDQMKIHLDVNLSDESKQFDDLIVTAGFKKLRIKVDLENFRDVHSHHREGKLKGRIAFGNGNEGFVVEATYLGKPKPFLRDTVFEGEALYSADFEDSRSDARVQVTCYIKFPDFDFDASDADGERLEKFTEKQNNIRKLALKEFIKDRCKIQGFFGEVSIAAWTRNV